MIGFLFCFAAGLAVGCVLGALAAAVYEVKTERDVDRILKDRNVPQQPSWGRAREFVEWTDRTSKLLANDIAPMAGVKVCSCIGAVRGPHFVDPECPFHGGAA